MYRLNTCSCLFGVQTSPDTVRLGGTCLLAALYVITGHVVEEAKGVDAICAAWIRQQKHDGVQLLLARKAFCKEAHVDFGYDVCVAVSITLMCGLHSEWYRRPAKHCIVGRHTHYSLR